MKALNSTSALCAVALMLFTPAAASAQEDARVYDPPQAYQAAPQPEPQYQLQPPYYPSQPPKPRLGMPIAFLTIGALAPIWGGILVANSYYADGGAAMIVSGGILFTLGVVFLPVRVRQRRRWKQEQAQARAVRRHYGLAPIIALERQLYGLQGIVNF